ncbi:DMT family transporter [Bacillus sp. mrc49]|uniref:DMT family transporter n=1 Tax=Bacillus sp. mrc49 TaxID=2054913 RepID=UPI0022B7EC8E|nr:DMT family transporter [Bacillus sp. mrc49]
MTAVASAPKWKFIGVVLGSYYVVVMVLVIPRIGIAPALVGVIVGQILIGTINDHFGLMGGARIPVGLKKVAGIGVLFISLFLINHK